MKRSEGIAYLTKNGEYNHLEVPGGRYNKTTTKYAPVAWRLAYLLSKDSGEPITKEQLDYTMGLVVNSHNDVAYLIRTYGYGHYV